jgi:Putative bacterial sensory transduction regulator
MKRRTTSLAAAALALAAAVTAAHGQSQSALADRITAGIVAKELRALGYSADIDRDKDNDPRVNTSVDNHKWAIYFYDCGAGEPEERRCESFQFFADNILPKPFPLQSLNKWNKEYRWAKAYVQQGDKPGCANANASCAVRIEVDILMAGTGADAAQTFRAYFAATKRRAEAFRKYIGAP